MAKGEIEPRQFTKSWTWVPLRRRGRTIEPTGDNEIKNKYIMVAMVETGRRVSTAMGY